jgi:hypothetical protein
VKFVRHKVYPGSEKDPTNMRICVNGRNESKTTEWRRKSGSKAETTDPKHDINLGGADGPSNYAAISYRCNQVADAMKEAALRTVVKEDGTAANALNAACLGTSATVKMSQAFLAACPRGCATTEDGRSRRRHEPPQDLGDLVLRGISEMRVVPRAVGARVSAAQLLAGQTRDLRRISMERRSASARSRATTGSGGFGFRTGSSRNQPFFTRVATRVRSPRAAASALSTCVTSTDPSAPSRPLRT